jgi:hypothetical protein
VNLLFLVEGEKTEPKIYKAWLSHFFPDLIFVDKPEEMTTNSCRIIPGNGYPNMVSTPRVYGGISRLEACLLDIKNYQNVDCFFICVDSEEETYQSRFDEIKSRLEEFQDKLGIQQTQETKFHIIVQHCCIETWALGNAEIPNECLSQNCSPDLAIFQAHYDVLVDDPEQMLGCPLGYAYSTKARFHGSYLKEYLKEFGLSYSKKNPKVAEEKKYLDALMKRCTSTHHLSSLRYLLDIWKQMKNRTREVPERYS